MAEIKIIMTCIDLLALWSFRAISGYFLIITDVFACILVQTWPLWC